MIEDFLELRASLLVEKTKALKEFLLSQSLGHPRISAVEGFLLSHQLVLIGSENTRQIRHVIFLTPRSGKFRVKKLLD